MVRLFVRIDDDRKLLDVRRQHWQVDVDRLIIATTLT
jgi:hypothetical protein